jgi:hypothetical protein
MHHQIAFTVGGFMDDVVLDTDIVEGATVEFAEHVIMITGKVDHRSAAGRLGEDGLDDSVVDSSEKKV